MARTTRKPPEGLSEKSLALWSSEVRHRTRSSGRLALLEQCLRALDRADEVRQLLATQALVSVTTTTGAAHLNPLLKLEKEARESFAKLANMLDLAWDASKDGEPAEATPYRTYLARTAQSYQGNGR